MDKLFQEEDSSHHGSYIGEIFFQGRDSSNASATRLSERKSHQVGLGIPHQDGLEAQANSVDLTLSSDQRKTTDPVVHDSGTRAVSMREYRPCFVRFKKQGLTGKKSMAIRSEGSKDVLLQNVINAVRKRQHARSIFPAKLNAQLEKLIKKF
uniref:Uncharacterized protein n=1 Tax=Guillardia theta TaxID=55529 RepID=A0A7S4M1G2_GUITH|mmetsp:Transcript_13539/g.47075  ORF Transcript_13539/g.47075 Transcript_13539/m.47075 type:complete len:152 (+) Transcript_13539:185-640(+)